MQRSRNALLLQRSRKSSSTNAGGGGQYVGPVRHLHIVGAKSAA